MVTRAKRLGLPVLAFLVLLGAHPRPPVLAAPPTPPIRVIPGTPFQFNFFFHNRFGFVPPVYPVAPYPYPAPYAPYYPAPYGGDYGDPFGGYLKGTADVINSQGQYQINTQQSYLLREQVRAAQLANRRTAFDLYFYEQARLPNLNDQREAVQRDELRRGENDPPLTEIWSGKALNALLLNLQRLKKEGKEGPGVPLAPELLRDIDLTTGKGNPGMLKATIPLDWPPGLAKLPPAKETAAARAQIDLLLARAKRQAAIGRPVDPAVLGELEGNIDKLHKALVNLVQEIPFGQYTDSKRFLGQLQEAVKVLQQEDASSHVTGKYDARGKTVRELLDHMTANGLRFAPAMNGEEAAYVALYQALLQYQTGANVPK